jgi:hypothetical protein
MHLKWLFILLLCSNKLMAQDALIKSIIHAPAVKQSVYLKQKQAGIFSMQLRCDYASPIINNTDTIFDINSVQVLAVDLVFTDYPAHLDLKQLNTQRLRNFFAEFPQLKNDNTVQWQMVRQTDGAEKAAAQNLFHGFVLYCRPLQTKAAMKADSSKLSDMLRPKPTVHIKHNGFLATDTTHLREQYEIEPYTILKKMPVKEALAYLDMDAKLIGKYPGVDSILVYEKPMENNTETIFQRTPPEDSTVIKVLNRLGWQRMLVVADVTASMYPYTGQLLLWLQMNEDERRIHQFVFFNDGDNKDESDKQPGRTGGIYTTASSEFETVEKLLYQTMRNGTGGAIPENNIEALLYGMEACPTCQDVVMIADNHSGVSDLVLLPMIKKPVRIIVCGVIQKINPAYLNIARSTGGSVHLAETDIQNLAALQEGEMITVGNYRYQIVKGKFVMQGE